jgi:hypothetical protein
MTKLNVNICSNCGVENPLYFKNCSGCKHYIRSVVVNINLWSTIYQIFENPRKSLKNIIYAEHKNFMIFLLFFISVKLFLFSYSVQSALNTSINESNFNFYNLLLITALYAFIISLFIKLLTLLLNKFNKTRFKDNLALFVFSSIPIIFSLFILTPVEYGIFGEHWFVFNPSPFVIKTNLAYILIGLEALMILWSITILYKAFHIQSNSKLFSIVVTLLFGIIFSTAIVFIPFKLV